MVQVRSAVGEMLTALKRHGAALPVAEAGRAVLRCARQTAELHAAGRLHGAVRLENVEVDSDGVRLAAPPGRVEIGGRRDHWCPPSLRASRPVSLPGDFRAARKVLVEVGRWIEPQQVDLYQLGALLCSLCSGRTADEYLRDPRAVAETPRRYRGIIDRALGLSPTNRFRSCKDLALALERAVEGSGPSVVAGELPVSCASSPGGRRRPPEDRPAFDRLGPYRIVETLGRGGMGDVYRARDESLGRDVAVKILAEHLQRQEAFVKRFCSEAAAAARIDHPNVVRIYATGDEDGRSYFAMQFVEGETLADLLARRGALSCDEAAAIAEQCLLGLAAAHEQGLIHRDVKPSNILLDAVGRRALLTDFGLAKAADAETQLTSTGAMLGTPDYVAPEQALGQAVDPRTDLYALGVVMYEMLAGRVPFTAETPTAVLYQHVNTPPPPIGDLAPQAGEGIARWVMRLLSKDPSDRPTGAAEALEELADAYRGTARTETGIRIVRMPALDQEDVPREDFEPAAPTGRLGRWWKCLGDATGFREVSLSRRLRRLRAQAEPALQRLRSQQRRLRQLQAGAEAQAAELARWAERGDQAVAVATWSLPTIPGVADREDLLRRRDREHQQAAEFAQAAAEQTVAGEDISAAAERLRLKGKDLAARLRSLDRRLGVLRWTEKRPWLHRCATAVAVLVLACLPAAAAWVVATLGPGVAGTAAPVARVVGFSDDFDQGVLHPDWTEKRVHGASVFERYHLRGGLELVDVMSQRKLDRLGLPWPGIVLTRPVGPMGSFTARLTLSWDEEESDLALQKGVVTLLGDEGEIIAECGYVDDSLSSPGRVAARCGDTTRELRPENMPRTGIVGVRLERVANVVSVFWQGELLLRGASETPVANVRLHFASYPYSGPEGKSFFGAVGVQRISVFGQSPAPGEPQTRLRLDHDTGKWVQEGFDVSVVAHVPARKVCAIAIGRGGAFGRDVLACCTDETHPPTLHEIWRINPAGRAVRWVTLPAGATSLAIPDPASRFAGYVYVGSGDRYWLGDKSIYRVSRSGAIEVFYPGAKFAEGLSTANAVRFSPPTGPFGDFLWTHDLAADRMLRIDSAGRPEPFGGKIPLSLDVLFDAHDRFGGGMFVIQSEKAEHGSDNDRIWRIAPDGATHVFLPDTPDVHNGGGAFTPPDSGFGGDLYHVDNNWAGPAGGRIYRVDPSGRRRIFALGFVVHDFSGVVLGPDGALYVWDHEPGVIYRVLKSAPSATTGEAAPADL